MPRLQIKHHEGPSWIPSPWSKRGSSNHFQLCHYKCMTFVVLNHIQLVSFYLFLPLPLKYVESATAHWHGCTQTCFSTNGNHVKSHFEGRLEGTFFFFILLNPKPGSCNLCDKTRQTKWHHIVVYCIGPDSHFFHQAPWQQNRDNGTNTMATTSEYIKNKNMTCATQVCNVF